MTNGSRRRIAQWLTRAVMMHLLVPHRLLLRTLLVVAALVVSTFGWWAGSILFADPDAYSNTPGLVCEGLWLLLLGTWVIRRAVGRRPAADAPWSLTAQQSVCLRTEADRLKSEQTVQRPAQRQLDSL